MTDWWNPVLDSMPVLVEGATGDSVVMLKHLLATVGAFDPLFNTPRYQTQTTFVTGKKQYVDLEGSSPGEGHVRFAILSTEIYAGFSEGGSDVVGTLTTNPYNDEFNSLTKTVLNSWKKSIAGPANGVCDNWTWKALMHSIDGVPDLYPGDAGMDVQRMQHLLSALKYLDSNDRNNFNGVWDDNTDAAKRLFCEAHGLAVDQPCDGRMWTSLLTNYVW